MGLNCKKYLGKMKSVMRKLDDEDLKRKERLKNADTRQKKGKTK